jgi:predicted amidohydrolase
MNNIRVSTAQFENRSNDKAYNLSVIESLTQKAAAEGSQVISFHECCISGYTFASHLSKEEMLHVAEFIPAGESILKLTEIAKHNNITILAGLFEKDAHENLFNTYVCVDKNGLVAKYRKLHPFINPYLKLTGGNAAY